jgi:hypothetical protein
VLQTKERLAKVCIACPAVRIASLAILHACRRQADSINRFQLHSAERDGRCHVTPNKIEKINIVTQICALRKYDMNSERKLSMSFVFNAWTFDEGLRWTSCLYRAIVIYCYLFIFIDMIKFWFILYVTSTSTNPVSAFSASILIAMFTTYYLTSMLPSVHSLPTGILRLHWLRFFYSFSSVVRRMPGYTLQRRGTARTRWGTARTRRGTARTRLGTARTRRGTARAGRGAASARGGPGRSRRWPDH